MAIRYKSSGSPEDETRLEKPSQQKQILDNSHTHARASHEPSNSGNSGSTLGVFVVHVTRHVRRCYAMDYAHLPW